MPSKMRSASNGKERYVSNDGAFQDEGPAGLGGVWRDVGYG